MKRRIPEQIDTSKVRGNILKANRDLIISVNKSRKGLAVIVSLLSYPNYLIYPNHLITYCKPQ